MAIRYYAEDKGNRTEYYFRWGDGSALIHLPANANLPSPLQMFGNMIQRMHEKNPKIEIINSPETNPDNKFRKLTEEEERIILNALKGK